MTNTKKILAMIESRARNDDEQFYSIALQIAAAEARSGRRQMAEEIRKAVDGARAQNQSTASVPLPFAKPRGELDGLLVLREPQFALDDVILAEPLKKKLGDLVREQLRRTWLREHGKVPNRRVLFLGPPGSGKTKTAEALAKKLKLPLFVIRLEALITRYMGETAAKLRLVFDEVDQRRAVYLFLEVDHRRGRRVEPIRNCACGRGRGQNRNPRPARQSAHAGHRQSFGRTQGNAHRVHWCTLAWMLHAHLRPSPHRNRHPSIKARLPRPTTQSQQSWRTAYSRRARRSDSATTR